MKQEYKSPVEGVYYEKGRNKWVAAIWIKGKKIKRRFDQQEDAEIARKNAEINKDFALNLINQKNIQKWEDFIRKTLLIKNGGFKEMKMTLNDIGKNNGHGEKTLNDMFQDKAIEVFRNCKNPMTDDSVRQIQIIIDFKPEEERNSLSIRYAVKSKLVPETAKGTVYDMDSLEPAIMGKSLPGQINMNDFEVEDAEYTEQK